jgi:DNA/RNA endonuclease YhcR with UshA esterase domain
MKRVALTLLLLAVVTNSVAVVTACRVERITAAQAKDYIGKVATVCGVVASARYAEKVKGSPTFLNLDKPYPTQIFTIVIWGSDRPKFGQPEVSLKGKRICVSGKIREYKGEPEVIVSEKSQLSNDQ